MAALRTIPSLRSHRARRGVTIAVSAVAGVSAYFGARKLGAAGWPLAGADLHLVVAAAGAYLAAYGFRAAGWQRLFGTEGRPGRAALAAASGAATVSGTLLPSRLDLVVKIAVLRKLRRSPLGYEVIGFSLVALGLADSVTLIPFATSAAALTGSPLVRTMLALVAVAGLVSLALLLAAPKLLARGGRIRFARLRGLAARLEPSAVGPQDALAACLWLTLYWAARAGAVFLLLAAMGIDVSPLVAVAVLALTAASAAIPVAPTGAGALQACAAATALVALGVEVHVALSFALASHLLLLMAAATASAAGFAWHAGRSRGLRPAPAPALG